MLCAIGRELCVSLRIGLGLKRNTNIGDDVRMGGRRKSHDQ